jgi:hypothetical protein
MARRPSLHPLIPGLQSPLKRLSPEKRAANPGHALPWNTLTPTGMKAESFCNNRMEGRGRAVALQLLETSLGILLLLCMLLMGNFYA